MTNSVTTKPKRVKLLGQTWKIKYEAPADGEAIGECMEHDTVILIKPGLPEQQEKSTLLHEIIHAIEYRLGLEFTEQQVLGLETGLDDLNKSNPRLFSYLRKQAESGTV